VRPQSLDNALRRLPPLLRELREAKEGLPPASDAELKVARSVTAVVSVFFALTALWEIGAPFGAGHDAAACAVTVGGENVWKLKTLLPVTEYLPRAATSADCYCHHPFGVFWTAAIARALFGHHDFVCRLPAVLLSAFTPWLVARLGRALWSPLSGALAALGFALTPIALAFANFNALEVPTIFGVTLASLAYVRFRQTNRRRFFGLLLFALAYALNSDWPAYLFAAALLFLLFLRVFCVGRDLSEPWFRRHAQLFAWTAFVVLFVGGAYAWVLLRTDQFTELWQQGARRATGADRPLAEVLHSRHYWILLMFTPLAIVVGKLGVCVSAARSILLRSELEAVPLAVLGMALFQYLVFSQGADVHVFWPHYFALSFALSLGALSASVRAVLARALARAPELLSARAAWLPFVSFALCVWIPLCMAPDAWSTLRYARKTGGRFNEKGAFIQPDKDKSAALRFLTRHLQAAPQLSLHQNMKRSLWVPWVLERPSFTASKAAPLAPGAVVSDGRLLDAATLQTAAARARTSVVGPFWAFEHGDFEPLHAYVIENREPEWWERLFVSSHHAIKQIRPDAFATWEYRDLLFQTPNPAPSSAPSTREQLRIAHNLALRAGDRAKAQGLRERLLAGADRTVATEYEDGTRLLAVRFEHGASDVLTLYFDSPGPDDQRFVVRSFVDAAPAGSLIPKDDLEWHVSPPPFIARASWRPEAIYALSFELLRRPGRERYLGQWVNTGQNLALRAKNGSDHVTLLVLP